MLKWLDDITKARSYPLRATRTDKVLTLIQMLAMIGLVVFGIIVLIQALIDHA